MTAQPELTHEREGGQVLAGIVNQRLLRELRLLRGDVKNTDHTDPDYLDGINAQDRNLADDLMGISAFGLVVPFARGRLRAAALALRAAESARLAAEARAEALEKEVERLRERVTTLQNDHLRAIRAGRELRETDEHAGVMAVLAARTAHSVEGDDALWVNPYEAQHLLAALAAGPDAGASGGES